MATSASPPAVLDLARAGLGQSRPRSVHYTSVLDTCGNESERKRRKIKRELEIIDEGLKQLVG